MRYAEGLVWLVQQSVVEKREDSYQTRGRAAQDPTPTQNDYRLNVRSFFGSKKQLCPMRVDVL